MRPAASTTLCQRGPSWPDRSFIESTLPTEERIRCTSSSLDISSEKIATGSPAEATLVAMLRVMADLPMAGRPAITRRLAFCMPASFLSKSTNPVARPVSSLPCCSSISMCSRTSLNIGPTSKRV